MKIELEKAYKDCVLIMNSISFIFLLFSFTDSKKWSFCLENPQTHTYLNNSQGGLSATNHILCPIQLAGCLTINLLLRTQPCSSQSALNKLKSRVSLINGCEYIQKKPKQERRHAVCLYLLFLKEAKHNEQWDFTLLSWEHQLIHHSSLFV